jgi:hypothetical protein
MEQILFLLRCVFQESEEVPKGLQTDVGERIEGEGFEDLENGIEEFFEVVFKVVEDKELVWSGLGEGLVEEVSAGKELRLVGRTQVI